MSLSLVREHAETLFVCSPYSQRFFPHIWRKFCVPQTTLHLPYSPYTLKYFPRILYRCLNTHSACSPFALKEVRARREKYSPSEGSRSVYVQIFGKLWFQGIYMDINRTISNFIFLYLKKNCSPPIRRLR